MSVKTHLKKTGNSRAFTVPAAFWTAHRLDAFASFKMDFQDGKIIIEPEIESDTSGEDAEIARLLDGFGSDNVHPDLLRTDRRSREGF